MNEELQPALIAIAKKLNWVLIWLFLIFIVLLYQYGILSEIWKSATSFFLVCIVFLNVDVMGSPAWALLLVILIALIIVWRIKKAKRDKRVLNPFETLTKKE